MEEEEEEDKQDEGERCPWASTTRTFMLIPCAEFGPGARYAGPLSEEFGNGVPSADLVLVAVHFVNAVFLLQLHLLHVCGRVTCWGRDIAHSPVEEDTGAVEQDCVCLRLLRRGIVSGGLENEDGGCPTSEEADGESDAAEAVANDALV